MDCDDVMRWRCIGVKDSCASINRKSGRVFKALWVFICTIPQIVAGSVYDVTPDNIVLTSGNKAEAEQSDVR